LDNKKKLSYFGPQIWRLLSPRNSQALGPLFSPSKKKSTSIEAWVFPGYFPDFLRNHSKKF
jgi:hypothetical protein